MWIINALFIIVVGLLGAISLVTKMVKESEKLFSVIVPFQGIIGIIGFGWGAWGVISCLLRLGWLGKWPLWWVTDLAVSVILLVLGFILGFGLISKFALSKNEEAKKKAEELLKTLASWQTLLGIIGICVGIWYFLYRLIIYPIIGI